MLAPPAVVKKYLESNFSRIKENDKEFIVCSPFVKDSEFKCYISKENGKFIDFRGGGERSGDFVRFVSLVKNISEGEAKQIVLEMMLDEGIDVFSFKTSPIKKTRIEKKPLPLPSCVNALLHPVSKKYLYGRGLNDETIDKFDLRYSSYNGYVVLPFYHNDEIVYYTQRNVRKFGMRWNNPINQEQYFSKSDIFFGEQALNGTDMVCLTEGSFDTMMISQWGVPALALNGCTISETQLEFIIKNNFKSIFMALDFDAPGIKATYNIANIIKLKFGIVVYYNHNVDFVKKVIEIGKDWSDLNKELFNEFLNGLQKFHKLSDIESLINNLGAYEKQKG
jgi:DNA primase